MKLITINSDKVRGWRAFPFVTLNAKQLAQSYPYPNSKVQLLMICFNFGSNTCIGIREWEEEM